MSSKKITFTFIIQLLVLAAYSQNLPKIQQTSLRAPANVKIDGKAADWGDKFEAKNPTTELLYTIANDDKKLYLIAQTDVETVINRISSGGIKLIIQKNGTKSEEGAAVVKFPYLPKGESIRFSMATNSMRTRTIVQGNSTTAIRDNSSLSKEEEEKLVDSVMKAYNKKLTGSLKWIYTRGIAAVDSLIPIYNDKGIEAAVSFDNKKLYTCEIAIDLKALSLSAAVADKFSYHLVVNGEPNKYAPVAPIIFGSTSADGTPLPAEQVRAGNERLQSRYAIMGATSDFWGEYTLAKSK